VWAQNSLPNVKDGACWESVETLHACVQEQYDRELDYEQRCTSYPEYQCAPAREQSAVSVNTAKRGLKSKSETKAVAVSQPTKPEAMAATATSVPPDAK
jgi:hypothetical protein